VTVSLPRFDPLNDRIEVTLKNLGLGPATLIAVSLYVGDKIISARLAPGLAPNESEVWSFLATGWDQINMPSAFEIEVRGNCQDPTGTWRRLHYLGAAGMPTAEALQTTVGETEDAISEQAAYSADDVETWVAQARVPLKIAARATLELNMDRAFAARVELWVKAPRDALDPEAFEAWARTEWIRLGAPPEGFRAPMEVAMIAQQGGIPQP